MADDPVQIESKRLKRLVQRLIDVYSPSGKEGDVLDLAADRLERAGLPVVHQAVDARRGNLVVTPPGVDPRLVLIGHLDTVPAHDLDRFGFREEGDRIFGLGAADMKGGCAAMIEAFRVAWARTDGRLPAVLALVVGEEEYGDGTEKLVEALDCPWALIGEPTGLKPCLGSYGYLEVQLAATGRRLHASLAERGRTAVEVVLEGVQRILEYSRNRHPELVLNIRDLNSSRAGFAVPERCEAWFDIHVPPGGPLEQIVSELEDEIGPLSGADEGPPATIRFATIDSGYELPDKGPVAVALRRTLERQGLGWQPELFRSHSDANLLWREGVRPMLLGPGQLEQAHTPDESIAFDQILSAARIYLGLLMELAAGL